MSRHRLLRAAGAVLIIGSAYAAQAETCDEASARARLQELSDALQRPESLKALDAAKADFAADQHFDNAHDAKYLAAAAAYFKTERLLDAGAIGDACLFLGQADKLINEVIAGQ
jgi:hypothetical protein